MNKMSKEHIYIPIIEKLHPNLTILSEYKGIDSKLLLKDEFDILYRSTPYKLSKGHVPSVISAVDKNDWFIKKSNLIHNNKYDYSKSIYIKSLNKLIITCIVHGDFSIRPNDHLNGIGCSKCGSESMSQLRANSISDVLAKFKLAHGNIYDYSEVKYSNCDSNVEIKCKHHGSFFQTPYNHYNGSGCPKCSSFPGFSKSSWIKFSNKNQNSDPKVYIIRCFNDYEEFIKIGITTKKVSERFRSTSMPYSYEILKEIRGSADFIFDKEKELHKLYYKFKYNPKIQFDGETECFNLEMLKDLNL